MPTTRKSIKRTVHKTRPETVSSEDIKIPINPYRPGGALSPNDLFVDRKNELSEIVAALREERSIAIYGQRRIGKTSLLNRIAPLAPKIGKNVEFVSFSMEPIVDEDDFLKTLASNINHPNLKDWETHTDFHLALKDTGIRYILVLDEFDKTADNPAFSANFFGALRSWCSQPWMDMVISSLFSLSDYSVQGYMTSPFYNVFQLNIPLEGIDEDASRELLSPLSKLEPQWKTNWENEIIKKTDGYPYRLQLFGFHAHELLIRKPTAPFEEAFEIYNQKLHISEPYEKIKVRKLSEHRAMPLVYSSERSTQPRKKRGLFRLPTVVIGGIFALGSFTALGGLVAESVALAIFGLAFIVAAGIFIILR